MATRKSARLETSTGSVSHHTVGEGDVPRTLAQGMGEQERAAFLGSVPALSRGLIARALAGTASPRQAIKAFCLTCTNYDRNEINQCPVWRCPLHAYRPRWASALAEGSDPGEESVPDRVTPTVGSESARGSSSGAAADQPLKEGAV